METRMVSPGWSERSKGATAQVALTPPRTTEASVAASGQPNDGRLRGFLALSPHPPRLNMFPPTPIRTDANLPRRPASGSTSGWPSTAKGRSTAARASPDCRPSSPSPIASRSSPCRVSTEGAHAHTNEKRNKKRVGGDQSNYSTPKRATPRWTHEYGGYGGNWSTDRPGRLLDRRLASQRLHSAGVGHHPGPTLSQLCTSDQNVIEKKKSGGRVGKGTTLSVGAGDSTAANHRGRTFDQRRVDEIDKLGDVTGAVPGLYRGARTWSGKKTAIPTTTTAAATAAAAATRWIADRNIAIHVRSTLIGPSCEPECRA